MADDIHKQKVLRTFSEHAAYCSRLARSPDEQYKPAATDIFFERRKYFRYAALDVFGSFELLQPGLVLHPYMTNGERPAFRRVSGAESAAVHDPAAGYDMPAEDGSGAAKAMELAMEEGGIQPSQVDYINAHGTSTHHNDLFETRAIKLALGDAAKDVVVNSTKSMIGHLLGAAGGVEFIVCVKSIQDGFIHQTMGTREADEECDLNYAIGAPVEKDVNYVLTNSLGFGGHNATLLLKKYEG